MIIAALEKNGETDIKWEDLRFGIQLGMLPSPDTKMPPSKLDRLTDSVFKGLGREDEI